MTRSLIEKKNLLDNDFFESTLKRVAPCEEDTYHILWMGHQICNVNVIHGIFLQNTIWKYDRRNRILKERVTYLIGDSERETRRGGQTQL